MKELPTMQELQSFITYNKTGSFTLAAQTMNITQSAFSAQTKKLERLVGVKLISRSTRGSRLTPEGELFLPEAELVLDTLERAIQSIRLASKVERPILNIGVLRSLGDIRLNGYVSHFFENHPEFSVSIYDMEEEELLLDLRENRIDIALLYLPNNKDMSLYESKALREDEFVYYAPKLIDQVKEAVPEPVQFDEIDASRQLKKFENQKLSLSNGIELIVPNNVYQDAESVEFIQNDNGTYSILIKNIEDIQSK